MRGPNRIFACLLSANKSKLLQIIDLDLSNIFKFALISIGAKSSKLNQVTTLISSKNSRKPLSRDGQAH
jgi:hypothetical protein